jgi:hypothetical protein
MRKILLGLAVLLLSLPEARAGVTPLSINIVPPAQFPPSDFTVAGVRASVIWGRHRNVYGFDLGAIGNMTDGNLVGLAAAGVFNLNRGESTHLGLQLAGVTNVNVNKARNFGLQVAGALNINYAESRLVGVQLAALGNYSPFTAVYGLQAGLYNKAREVYGFQIGLINVVENLHGIQIGLVNFNTRGLFAVAPILNVGF